ncbi:hypothetical protein P7H15_00010 [Paenibacillus larvae]|nr:hypothetical protein [Paenibacillus larvae]MDT2291629.1 hypothetical protein [Paenibacillus larvae]
MDKKELRSKYLRLMKSTVKEMERYFKEHESIETVVVDPNSWVGKRITFANKKGWLTCNETFIP